jgi:hypothetical protein
MEYLFSYTGDSGKEVEVWIDTQTANLYYRIFIKA